MASLRTARVSLRIFGDDLDPDGVSALLGGVPTFAYRKGETPDGDVLPAATGAWVLETSLSDSDELEEHVTTLLAKLTGDPDEWATLSAEFAVDLRCDLELAAGGPSGDGVDVSPRLAGALAERGVVLSFALTGAD
jgi:hypothetical protein